jgi:hypothetical protein
VNCAQNQAPNRSLFGDVQVWKSSNKRRIQRNVEGKLQHMKSIEVKEMVLKMIQKDLDDLEITLEI